MLLISVLAAVVAIVTRWDDVFFGGRTVPRELICRGDIITLTSQLNTYRMKVGSLPTTEQGLEVLRKYRYPNDTLKDPWGHDFVYKNPGDHNRGGFDLYSKGPDGIDSDDDIRNW